MRKPMKEGALFEDWDIALRGNESKSAQDDVRRVSPSRSSIYVPGR